MMLSGPSRPPCHLLWISVQFYLQLQRLPVIQYRHRLWQWLLSVTSYGSQPYLLNYVYLEHYNLISNSIPILPIFPWLFFHLILLTGRGTEDIVRRYPHPSRLFLFCLHLFDSDPVSISPAKQSTSHDKINVESDADVGLGSTQGGDVCDVKKEKEKEDTTTVSVSTTGKKNNNNNYKMHSNDKTIISVYLSSPDAKVTVMH